MLQTNWFIKRIVQPCWTGLLYNFSNVAKHTQRGEKLSVIERGRMLSNNSVTSVCLYTYKYWRTSSQFLFEGVVVQLLQASLQLGDV